MHQSDKICRIQGSLKMKRVLIIALLPVLLLTSCKGREISESDAESIKTKIKEEMSTVKNQDIIMKSSSTRRDDDGKNVSSDLTYHLVMNQDGEGMFTMNGTYGNEKYDLSVYKVKDEEYEEICYIKNYNSDTKEYEEYTYTERDDLSYNTHVTSYTFSFLAPAIVYSTYSDPTTIDQIDKEIKSDDGTKRTNTLKYYSKNENNLTIEITTKVDGYKKNEGDEIAINGSETITYDNLRLKSVVVKSKTNYNNANNLDISVDYHNDEKIDISLPNGWEKHIAN